MASHEQGQKNINATDNAWTKFQKFFQTNLPRSKAHLINAAAAASGKRSYGR